MSDNNKAELDAIVIGAGFGGIYMLHKLRNELGLSVRAFDKAADVGGTWYWNRYPGAKSDSESYLYQYSFDKELFQEWERSTRYLEQAARQARQGGQQDSVIRLQLRPAHLTLQHCQLVAQHHQLDVFGRVAQQSQPCQLQRLARQEIDP